MIKRLTIVLVILFNSVVASSQTLSPVYLNHAYTVLDSITYTAIQNSKFLKEEFSNFREETKFSNNGKTWTGLYLYGKQTYIEFFQAGRFPQFKSNESGIGFGVEQQGAVKIYYQRLKEKFGEQAETGLTTRLVDTTNVPWFYDAGINYHDNDQTFFDWLMEYEPNYLRHMYADLKPGEDGITRKQNLSRDFKKESLFENITEVSIELDSKERDRLVKELQAFNYKISNVKDKIIADGPGIRFIVSDNATANGITSLKMKLTRKLNTTRVYKFGARSVLTLKGTVAYWTF